MESEVTYIIKLVAFVVELCSASILLYGFLKVFLKFWVRELHSLKERPGLVKRINELKPLIGSYILLGLDFYIISDILSSMVAQDQNSLIRLACVVVIRTLIGYFLAKEVDEHSQTGSPVHP